METTLQKSDLNSLPNKDYLSFAYGGIVFAGGLIGYLKARKYK